MIKDLPWSKIDPKEGSLYFSFEDSKLCGKSKFIRLVINMISILIWT